MTQHELQRIEDDFRDTIPKYNKEDIDKMSSIWEYITYFKWIINFVLVAIPHLVISIAAVVFHIWF